MAMPTGADDEVSAWCAAGPPPIYFGFGSMPLGSFSATVNMISEACAELGERALSARVRTTSTRVCNRIAS